VRRLRLRRIRSGARLRGFIVTPTEMSAEEYAFRVAQACSGIPTAPSSSVAAFHILAGRPGYLRHDRGSLGYAAVIEWMNREVATAEHQAGRDRRFDGSATAHPSTDRPPAS